MFRLRLLQEKMILGRKHSVSLVTGRIIGSLVLAIVATPVKMNQCTNINTTYKMNLF